MCPPRRPRRPTPAPPPRRVEPRPTPESSPTADRMSGRVERTPPPPPPPSPAPAPEPTPPPPPTEPAPKMRTIARTSAGTTVSGRQTTSTAPSRRRRQSARMGRRSGTRSLRISRNPNTGQGDLLY